jgi:hypothetical protein
MRKCPVSIALEGKNAKRVSVAVIPQMSAIRNLANHQAP